MIDTIIQGDCLDIMRQMPDGCIDLTVTSPPYDNLRTYKGYTFDFEGIAKELYRITKKGGVVVWVVGDQTVSFCESLTSFKQAIYFVDICGFNLLDTMIYVKTNYAPIYPSAMRYAGVFEFMYIFTKGKPSTFNAIQQDKVNVSTISRIGKYRKANGEFVVKNMDIDTGRKTKDATNVWAICPTASPDSMGHPAIFPEQLARDHILSWSNEGDLVADIMCGSGTTCKMAVLNNRHYLGIDIAEEYCEIARKRVAEAKMIKDSQPELFEKVAE